MRWWVEKGEVERYNPASLVFCFQKTSGVRGRFVRSGIGPRPVTCLGLSIALVKGPEINFYVFY